MTKLRHLVLLLLFVSTPKAVSAGGPGSSGALFLRFGLGARASGMGEAFTAVAKDATSIAWNPGAMAAVLGTNLTFMHNEYFQSIRLEQAALTHETDLGTFGLAFTGLYMDEMDRFDNVPSAVPLGTFSAYDVSFTVGYARYILPNLAVGISAKGIFENIDDATARGVAFDAGIYHVSEIPGVKFAAMIANVGSPINFKDDFFTGEEFSLPRLGRIGASWERSYPSIRSTVLAALDIVFPNDGDARQHIGVEYGYRRRMFLRGGFKGGYDSQGATFGIGVKYQKIVFDYAVQFISNDLGDSHRFGFSLRI